MKAPESGADHGETIASCDCVCVALEIAAVLYTNDGPYSVSLDGNEQYNDISALLELWRRMQGTPQLKRLVDGILFIEQPITRAK